MKMLVWACALALGLALPGRAAADVPPPPTPPAPDIFVLSLYHTKLESEAVSPEFGRAQTDSLILNYFSAELLALYKSTFSSPEPIVDADVFMMAQDWDTKEVATKTTAQTATTATVDADFQIAGQPRKVTFTLSLIAPDVWQIEDIASDGVSLRQMIASGTAATP